MAKSDLPSWQVPPAGVNTTKPCYGFYVIYGMRFIFVHFSQLYAAKALVDLMLDGDEYTRESDHEIVSTRGVLIRMENPNGRKGPSMFDEVLHHKYTPQEEAFTFPESFLRDYGSVPRSKTTQQAPSAPEVSNDQQIITKAPQRAPSTPKPARKPLPDNLVTVATIATDLKIDAKQARQALRKAKIEKPEHGAWAFTPDQVPAIVAAIKEHLK